MNPSSREKFLTFNIGHLLTLISIIGGAVGVYTAFSRSDERQEARLTYHDAQIADHAHAISAHTEAIAKLDRIGTTRNTEAIATETRDLALLRAQVAEHEIALRKLDVITNDLAWIKQEMMRQRTQP
jgi:hypothetical protein